ncbi:hypothetical protein [Nodularia sp. NIES-3585]|uniref:hypothetical protein n=1 Tax=Nodularia sp. NIES-3585 TaxID=1973477 RepID=UPI000B5C6B17|nr:hypothetical protein [Nodularia sp. NIES-3585]GAX38817.1 hypothetical protein NIES3585_48690 [Nodularia sp. NIES-3585]
MVSESQSQNDANSRLKARLRPSVPPRETSVFKKNDPETSNQSDQELSLAEQKNTSVKSIQVGSEKLVPFTLRVEDSVDKGLKILCTNEHITKETFLEAAYLICSEDEQVMQRIVEVAKSRRQKRRITGVQRRASSMSKYLPENQNE